ncbi:MAG: PEP/pyruvate-binding domain-containing protein, partial [Xanthobacteraceae bacterium]
MTRFIIPLSNTAATAPERVGPKAANLATLSRAGLPTPGGFCITADAYHRQVQHLGLGDMIGAYARADQPVQRRLAVEIRLKLYQSDLAPDVLADVLAAWWAADKPAAVRSSSLIEDRADANFAGQFESFLGVREDAEFLTTLRACWAALWTTTARRSMAQLEQNPADTAMAVLVQPLVKARASGGGLSETADGHMLISATWGLGSAIAQGEVVPDRVVLTRHGFVRSNEAGRKHHREACVHDSGNSAGTSPQKVPDELVSAPCLEAGQATVLGRLMRKCEDVLGMPVEIEWALDDAGFKLLQARPLHVAPAHVPDEIWLKHPGLNGHPAGIGWGSGRAVVVNCECELSRVAPGDILVTRVAGPALS